MPKGARGPKKGKNPFRKALGMKPRGKKRVNGGKAPLSHKGKTKAPGLYVEWAGGDFSKGPFWGDIPLKKRCYTVSQFKARIWGAGNSNFRVNY